MNSVVGTLSLPCLVGRIGQDEAGATHFHRLKPELAELLMALPAGLISARFHG